MQSSRSIARSRVNVANTCKLVLHGNGMRGDTLSRTRDDYLNGFDEAMNSIHEQAASLKPPFRAPEFVRMVQVHGGKETADRLLASGDVSRGFSRLWERDPNLLKLSMEYLVLQDPWRALFTADQLQKARQRLQDYRCPLPSEDAMWQRLDAAVAALGQVVDDRAEPDSYRLGALRRGWTDALDPAREYSAETLSRLTWHNLGYRLGKEFGAATEATTEAVFNRLANQWGRPAPIPPLAPTSDRDELERRINELRGKKIGNQPPPEGTRRPERVLSQTGTACFKRDPNVAAWVLDVSNGVCELCRSLAPFKTPGGEPFLEVHHVAQLANDGPDTIDNTVALCPNCHRRCHYGEDRDEATKRLYTLVERLKLP